MSDDPRPRLPRRRALPALPLRLALGLVAIELACHAPPGPARAPASPRRIASPSGTPGSTDPGARGSRDGGAFDGAIDVARDVARADAPGPHAATHYDVNHVLATGQSLAVGVAGRPVLTKVQPFHNQMFNAGVMTGDDELTGFVPLVEGDVIPGSHIAVETMSSAFANLVTALSPPRASEAATHDLLVSVHAAGALPYAKLKRGTKPYARGMAQVEAAQRIAAAAGLSYVVRAVTTVHGESDHAEKSLTYESDLREWQADYERDVRARTGQREPVPMFETQISSWTRMMKGTTTSAIPEAQLQAHVKSGGKIVLVGPKYHLPYAPDGVHLTNHGYRHMGEDYAKAYARVIVEGRPWEPVRPIAIAREGAVVTVRFAVPAPPLVLDTKRVADPGNFGFEYTDDSSPSDDPDAAPIPGPGPPAIARVELSGPDVVTITLTAAPTATGGRIRYAFTGARGLRAGPFTGPRGNLRDSDATKSQQGYELFNWCVHFDEPVP